MSFLSIMGVLFLVIICLRILLSALDEGDEQVIKSCGNSNVIQIDGTGKNGKRPRIIINGREIREKFEE